MTGWHRCGRPPPTTARSTGGSSGPPFARSCRCPDRSEGARRRLWVGGPVRVARAQGADVVGGRPQPGHGGRGPVAAASIGPPFVVADLAEPLALERRGFDGITCSLALHYLRDWRVAMHSFATVLRPGGWMVVSLDHPFGPPFPGAGRLLRHRTGERYLAEGERHRAQRFWRRPLSAVVDQFAEAGFVIERVLEPQPSAEALERFPRRWTRWSASRGSSSTDSGSPTRRSPRAALVAQAGGPCCCSANRAAAVANLGPVGPPPGPSGAPSRNLLVERRRPGDHGAGTVGRACHVAR